MPAGDRTSNTDSILTETLLIFQIFPLNPQISYIFPENYVHLCTSIRQIFKNHLHFKSLRSINMLTLNHNFLKKKKLLHFPKMSLLKWENLKSPTLNITYPIFFSNIHSATFGAPLGIDKISCEIGKKMKI